MRHHEIARRRRPGNAASSTHRPAATAAHHPDIRHILHAPRPQAKLTVGAPDDAFEKEADQVADRVMRTPEPAVQRMCSECEEELQAKEEPGRTPTVPAGFEQSLAALEGNGRPLPAAERAFFEPRFGCDFNDVRLHSGPAAGELASSVHARAFTLGDSIVLGAGQYSPGTSDGRRLLAHELTHVVQQGGGRAQGLQRKIVVGGTPYTPTATYLTWLKANYSEAMVEFINSMHNGGSPPEFLFDSFEQMGNEVRVRHFAVQGIEEVHKGCCSYATGGGDGKLDTTYWDKKGPYQFVVKSPLPSGKEASDAVEAIFASGAGSELECNSTTVAIQYRAMLKALGKAAFNKKFPAGAGIVISPHHVPPAGVSVHPFWDKKLYKTVTISSSAELLPGDWVYFKNVLDYGAKHPGGFWTGEHALYLGGGKFRGFGTKEMSEEDMNKELLKQYNAGLAAADQKVLADVPGRQGYARRPVIAEITK